MTPDEERKVREVERALDGRPRFELRGQGLCLVVWDTYTDQPTEHTYQTAYFAIAHCDELNAGGTDRSFYESLKP